MIDAFPIYQVVLHRLPNLQVICAFLAQVFWRLLFAWQRTCQVLRMPSIPSFNDLFPVLEGLVQRLRRMHGSAGLAKRARGFMRPMKLKSSVRTSRKAARSKTHLCNRTMSYISGGQSPVYDLISERYLVSWRVNTFKLMCADMWNYALSGSSGLVSVTPVRGNWMYYTLWEKYIGMIFNTARSFKADTAENHH